MPTPCYHDATTVLSSDIRIAFLWTKCHVHVDVHNINVMFIRQHGRHVEYTTFLYDTIMYRYLRLFL